MITVLIALAAFLASLLTFFSGFGLGTLLLAVMTLYFPVEAAVTLTAIVHFSNNLFKIGLIGRHLVKQVVLWFGLPALLAAVAGAWLLKQLEEQPPLFSYEIGSASFTVAPLPLTIGLLLIVFAILDELPLWSKLEGSNAQMAGGGVLSGFFGGLSGHQGALRSLFLVHARLSKEAYVATGTTIALLVDAARLPVYFAGGMVVEAAHMPSLIAAVAAALAGALIGRQLLKKVTFKFLQKVIMVLLIAIGLLLAAGVI